MSYFGFEFPIFMRKEEQPSAADGKPGRTTQRLGALASEPSQEDPADRPKRAAYVVANQDWPAVSGLSPDNEAYDAIVATYQRVTDQQYNLGMKQMSKTPDPTSPSEPGTSGV